MTFILISTGPKTPQPTSHKSINNSRESNAFAELIDFLIDMLEHLLVIQNQSLHIDIPRITHKVY